MVERAKPVMRAIKLTPPRPSARASSATNRRRLCSFNTGAICRYRLRAARACAARIMHPSYVARFLAVNPPHAFLRRLWPARLSCLWTGPKIPPEGETQMAYSLYDAAVTPCAQQLSALAGIIDKAAAHCAANKIEETALLQDRLYPDMFCLARQIRQSADFAM